MKHFPTIIALVALFVAVLSLLLHDRTTQPYTTADTIIVRDTIREVQPVCTESLVVRTERVRVPYAVHHTDALHVTTTDTIEVTLPITQKIYRDTAYTAYVSGYRPSLDSIHIYRERTVVTQSAPPAAKPRRWGIGLQGGYGITPRGFQPYVGLGVQFRIICL